MGNGFNPARAAHAYGTLKITNNLPQFAPGSVRIHFVQPSLSDGNAVGWSLGPTSGDCVAMYGSDALRPKLLDNQPVWGPVPFDLVLGDYLTPNFPNGDLTRLAKPFRVSAGAPVGASFTLQPYVP